jgi:hypothetical protein
MLASRAVTSPHNLLKSNRSAIVVGKPRMCHSYPREPLK